MKWYQIKDDVCALSQQSSVHLGAMDKDSYSTGALSEARTTLAA